MLAPFIGSFLGVVVTRHERPVSALTGRSACAHCGAVLGPCDLVPILSWIGLGGKCRHCGGAVGLFYPVMELAALAVAIWSASLFSGLTLWASCGLGWTLLALAATDLRYFILPDILTLPLIAAGFLANAFLDLSSLTDYGLGAVAGYLFVRVLRFTYRVLRKREGMGLGDAKLFAAAGAWVSWWGLPTVLVLASVLGLAGVLIQSWRGHRLDPMQRVPFGAFLSAGLWITWLYGPLTRG
ncbi:MAG TPA: A24 family peptidase [Rhizomicrobium sp.]|nr:A24 family peptidase [Rhizomicrobium sp.]